LLENGKDNHPTRGICVQKIRYSATVRIDLNVWGKRRLLKTDYPRMYRKLRLRSTCARLQHHMKTHVLQYSRYLSPSFRIFPYLSASFSTFSYLFPSIPIVG